MAMGAQLFPAPHLVPPAGLITQPAQVPFDPNYQHPVFGSVDRGSEHIVLESFAPAPWGKKKPGWNIHDDGWDKKGKVHISSSGGGSSSSGGIWDTDFENDKGKLKPDKEVKKGFKFFKGKGKKKGKEKGKKRKDGCYCKIARKDKGEDAALITLGSIGLPLAVFGSIFGSGLGALLAGLIASQIPNIPGGRAADKAKLIRMLTDPNQPWMKIASHRVKRGTSDGSLKLDLYARMFKC
jgi:hypothetical protein